MATQPTAGKDTSMPPEMMTTISQMAKHMVKIPARARLMAVAGLRNAGSRMAAMRQKTTMT